MEKRESDPRVQRTQTEILRSFDGLVLERGFEAVNVGDVVESAGVGRSTFYEHFRNKDELLETSVTRILLPLADAVTPAADTARVRFVLDHFLESRPMVREMLNGPTATTVVRRLADLIEERLSGKQTLLPRRLAAVQIAESQMGVVRAWLNGAEAAHADELAEAIVRASTSMATALGFE